MVGEASGVPGSGVTVTGLAAAAATDAWSPSAIEAEVALPPQELSATAASAARSSAVSAAMRSFRCIGVCEP